MSDAMTDHTLRDQINDLMEIYDHNGGTAFVVKAHVLELIDAAQPATPANATDTAGLVRRLRKYGKAAGNPNVIADYSEELALRAADALSALRASIDRANAANEALAEDVGALRAENERLTAHADTFMSANETLRHERDRLQAELDAAKQQINGLLEVTKVVRQQRNSYRAAALTQTQGETP